MGMVSGEVIARDIEAAEYAVFDDMRGGISFFPAWKEWMGAQAVVTVKQLYKDPKQMKWGKPTIWLANQNPIDQLTDAHDRCWLEDNCDIVYVGESFISHASTE